MGTFSFLPRSDITPKRDLHVRMRLFMNYMDESGIYFLLAFLLRCALIVRYWGKGRCLFLVSYDYCVVLTCFALNFVRV